MNNSNDWEGVISFPQNRTLYIDQFSEKESAASTILEGFQALDLEYVFDHYKPSKEVGLVNEDGELVVKQFQFRSVEDFEDDFLIEQSELLTAEKNKIDTCNEMIRQMEKNKSLRSKLLDENACASLIKCIVALMAELSQRKANKDSVKQDDFLLLKGIIKQIEGMDPSHEAAKDIFLNDPSFDEARRKLNDKLSMWASTIERGKPGIDDMIKICKSDRDMAELNLQRNLFQIHDEIRHLEVTYRTLETFFANASQANPSFLTVMNVDKKDLLEPDSEGCVAVQREMKRHYDALSLKDSYSLLVVPGYLGDAPTIREWAKIAHKNKVLMITDFKDCPNFRILNDELSQANLQGSDKYMSNVIVTSNYLLARKKSELANEDDDVFIPSSGALAGRLACTQEISIAQGVVGLEYGFLNNVKGARLDLLKSEIAVLVGHGVIPIIENNGKTYALSNRSLYKGASLSLQEYPIVRVLDWVNKVLMNYIHDIALETWDTYASPQKLENTIRNFLDHYRGYRLLFSSYKLNQPSQDEKTKVVTVEISITPFHSSKNLVIKLEADNKEYMNADTNIAQEQ